MLARFKHPPSSPDAGDGWRSVLVTGASGRIGTRFAEETHQRYRLSLLTHPEESGDLPELEKFGSVLQGRLQDIETLKQACRGIDTVLHLAANPSPSAKRVPCHAASRACAKICKGRNREIGIKFALLFSYREEPTKWRH